MSVFKINQKQQSNVGRVISSVDTAMKEQGIGVASKELTSQALGMESLSTHDLASLDDHAAQLQDILKDAFDGVSNNLGMESLSIASIEAGTLAAMAAGDPLAYAKQANTSASKTANGVVSIGAESAGEYGLIDFRDKPAMESFDQTTLRDMIPYSIAFNTMASRQDEFSEAFYPTSVASPETGGMDVSVEFTSVFNHVKRSADGNPTTFNQKNLLAAVADAEILADESTKVIPHLTSSNADKFVDSALVASRTLDVAGVEVTTAPLLPRKEIDLIGISAHPGLLGSGILDNTDALDTRISLKKIYLANTFDNGGTPVTEAFGFTVDRLPSNSFIDSIEGSSRSMLLNFSTNAITLNKDTKLVDGSVPAVLTEVIASDFTVRLNVSVTGSLNVELGSIRINDAGIVVSQIVDPDGETISLTSGVGLAIVEKLEAIALAGYDIDAARTNTNRRSRGLLLNNRSYTERFAIPLGSPISAPSPTGSDRDTRDIEALILAARIRNSNNAVTSLLNYSSSLKAYVEGAKAGMGELNIEGVARHIVNPVYIEKNIDLAAAMNSIRAKDRGEDISSTLVNLITDVAYRMYNESGLQAALDASSMGSKRPKLVIGTDATIQRHLIVSGDTRTYGPTFDGGKTVHTLDTRMKNKIVVTFAREGSEGTPDALTFGTHAWIPELTSSMQVTRDGATYQEAMVQPRSRHINNLPVMAVINVENLEEVVASKID